MSRTDAPRKPRILTAGLAAVLLASLLAGDLASAAPSVTSPTITSAPSAFVRTRTWSVSFTGDPGNTFKCSLDGGSYSACTSPKSGTGLADGSHTLRVVAVDGSSNESVPTSTSWTVDTVRPAQPTLTGTPPALTNDTTAEIGFMGEADAVFECSIDGAAWSSCDTPVTRTGLSDGSYSVAVRQTDQAGNVSVTATASWTVDTIAPGAVTIGSAPTGTLGTSGASGDIAFTGAEAGGTFTCELDGEFYPDCSSPFSFSGLGEGPHEFVVFQTDAAGNDGPTSSTTWTLDLTGPSAPVLTENPSDPSNDTTPTFDFTPENNTTYTCVIDGGLPFVCTPPVTLPSLGDGTHTLEITGTDDLGNVGDKTTYTWEVDTTAPDPPGVTNVPSSGTHDTTASLNLTGEPGATFECRVNGGTWTTCTSPLELSGLTDGLQTVEVRQTDPAGNTSDVTTVSWYIGDEPPAPPAGEVGLYLSGPGSKVIDGVLWFRVSTPQVNTIWPAGARTVTISNSPVFSRSETHPVGETINWKVPVAIPGTTDTRPIYAKFAGDSRINPATVYQVNFKWDRAVPVLRLAARKRSLGFSPDNWNVRLDGFDRGTGLRNAQFWMRRNGRPTLQSLSIGPGFVGIFQNVMKVPGGYHPIWVRPRDAIGNAGRWYLIR